MPRKSSVEIFFDGDDKGRISLNIFYDEMIRVESEDSLRNLI